MSKIQKCAFLLSGATALCLLMFAARSDGQPANTPPSSPWDDFFGKLRSQEVRELARAQYAHLTMLDVGKFRGAVDVFHDLRATGILLRGLEHPNYEAKLYALEALGGFAQPGDVELCRSLLQKLGESNVLTGGGSEVHIPKAEYRQKLLGLIGKVSGQDGKDVRENDPKALAEFLEKTRNWIRKHQQAESKSANQKPGINP